MICENCGYVIGFCEDCWEFKKENGDTLQMCSEECYDKIEKEVIENGA